MQVLGHVLERSQQAADLILRADLQTVRQIALRHGFGQMHGTVDRAGDRAGDEATCCNGKQRCQHGQYDHLDLRVGTLCGGFAHVVLHLAGLVIHHLVDQHVVLVLQAAHVALVQNACVFGLVGIDQLKELAHARTVSGARLELFLEERLARIGRQHLLQPAIRLSVGLADGCVVVHVLRFLVGRRGQEQVAEDAVGLVTVVLDLVAQCDQRIALADDPAHLRVVVVQPLDAHRGSPDQQRHHKRERCTKAHPDLHIRDSHLLHSCFSGVRERRHALGNAIAVAIWRCNQVHALKQEHLEDMCGCR